MSWNYWSQLLFIVANASALENFSFMDFLKDVRRFHRFEQILLMGNKNSTIASEYFSAFKDKTSETTNDKKHLATEIMEEIEAPLLQMNELTTFYLKQKLSEQTLTVLNIDGTLNQHTGLIKNMVMNLRHMTTSNVIILMNAVNEDDSQLTELFHLCWNFKIINVIVLYANFQKSATFYGYTYFPNFKLEKKTIHSDVLQRREIFPNRLGNLAGYKLPIILGGSDPRIIVYTNLKGETVVAGFVGHFLHAFAKKFNAQLVEPLPAKMGAFAPAQQLIQAVRNGTVDISAGLTFPSIPIIGYSYPYEQMNWCLMMPVEPEVPGYEFFIIVFELSAFIITLLSVVIISMLLSRALYQAGYKPDLFDIFLHDNCLRGVLGQSFSEISNPTLIVRFVYLKICVLGILMTTSYNAYFSTYVTSAPKQPALNTFDAILASGRKVYAWTPEYNELVGRVADFKKYEPMFYQEPDYQKYLKMRDSFNTKYGYMVPTTKWIIFNEQQKVFTTPIFRRREDLCFFNNIPMCFPIHENSIYKETLYQLMLETAQAGLTDRWHQNGFIELIVADRLSFADLSKKNEFTAMETEELKYIWFGYAVMVVVVWIVFIAELLIFHREKIQSKTQILFKKIY